MQFPISRLTEFWVSWIQFPISRLSEFWILSPISIYWTACHISLHVLLHMYINGKPAQNLQTSIETQMFKGLKFKNSASRLSLFQV